MLGEGEGGLVVGACVLRSNSYPVILKEKVPVSYNPLTKLT